MSGSTLVIEVTGIRSCHWSWLSTLCIFLSVACYADGNIASCVDIDEAKNKFIDMWQYRTLDSQNDLMACVADAWTYFDSQAEVKSAEFTYTASAYLLSALQFDLENFARFMDKHDGLNSKWLKEVDQSMFVWRDYGECEYAKQLEQIKGLINAADENVRERDSYKRILGVFAGLECRVVD